MEKDIMDYTISFQRGEEEGFAYFYRLMYRPLVGYGFKLLGNPFVTEDLVQKSFTKLWELHADFTHHLVIKKWLFITLRNECYKHYNNTRIRNRHNDIIASQSDEAEEPKGWAIDDDTDRMTNTVKSLPKECKKVIIMIFYMNMDINEIAASLSISTSTVKSQKARGLELLRARLGVSTEQYKENVSKLLSRVKKSIAERGIPETAKLYNLSRGGLEYAHIAKTMYLRS